MNSFFAMMARMKYIERWALMRSSIKENISEHSLEVAMIAHALAIIANKKCGKKINAEKVALMGIYHDATEIITGDMPTPVKYYDEDIKKSYKHVEKIASLTLLRKLPDYMREEYEPLFFQKEDAKYEWKLVKAADKLSAYIKCIEEMNAGNKEFSSAKKSTKKALDGMQMEEADIFVKEFIDAYSKTLDELQES